MLKNLKRIFYHYIVDMIDDESSYDTHPNNDSAVEKVRWLKSIFMSEYSHGIKQYGGLRNAIESYIRGLPSSISIEFDNTKILEKYEELTGTKIKEKNEIKIIDEWFPMIADRIFELFMASGSVESWMNVYGESYVPYPTKMNVSEELTKSAEGLYSAIMNDRSLVVSREVSNDRCRKDEYNLHYVNELGILCKVRGDMQNENDRILLNLTKYESINLGVYYGNELYNVLKRIYNVFSFDNVNLELEAYVRHDKICYL